ncbi:MAG: V-type ATPase subunit [Oscillospiraceae bacterium]|nr:V-type ATPase subunit [Oscillospiraceae bacterium]
MATKRKDTDYLFLSGRIRSLERRALNRQQVERMLLAPTVAESAQVLTELGYPAFDTQSVSSLHAALAQHRAELFADLVRYMPEPAVLDVFRIKYDYHNLKTIIKSQGGDFRPLLIDAGRIGAQTLAACYERTGKWDFLPPAMGRAAAESARVLAETGDPQRSDFILDRACFAEMLALARQSRCDYLVSYVRTLIDAANLRDLVRTQRMHRPGGFLQQVLFDGGTVAVSEILAGIGNGAATLWRSTPLRDAAVLGDGAIAGGSLTDFEKACDNAVMKKVNEARSVPFGVEVVIGYIAAQENELVAVRTILSGRMAGMNPDMIRERLRDPYV